MLPISFAPMQGYTYATFRRLHHTMWGGVDEYYTPFIRIEKGQVRRKDLADIDPVANEGVPLVPQMLPRNAAELCRLAQLFIDNGYHRADLNLSCPFPPIALHGRGAGLLPHPDAVRELLHATQRFPQLSFSVKIRLGWDNPAHCLALAQVLNDYPLHHVTLHPRTGKQQYKGNLDMETFHAFAARCKVPLIYNGALAQPGDVHSFAAAHPGLKGLMIGRALLATPQLAAVCAAGDEPLWSLPVIDRLQQFHTALCDHLAATSQGDTQLLNRLHSLWEYFLADAPRPCLKRIAKSTNLARYNDAVALLFDTLREQYAG